MIITIVTVWLIISIATSFFSRNYLKQYSMTSFKRLNCTWLGSVNMLMGWLIDWWNHRCKMLQRGSDYIIHPLMSSQKKLILEVYLRWGVSKTTPNQRVQVLFNYACGYLFGYRFAAVLNQRGTARSLLLFQLPKSIPTSCLKLAVAEPGAENHQVANNPVAEIVVQPRQGITNDLLIACIIIDGSWLFDWLIISNHDCKMLQVLSLLV